MHLQRVSAFNPRLRSCGCSYGFMEKHGRAVYGFFALPK